MVIQYMKEVIDMDVKSVYIVETTDADIRAEYNIGDTDDHLTEIELDDILVWLWIKS